MTFGATDIRFREPDLGRKKEGPRSKVAKVAKVSSNTAKGERDREPARKPRQPAKASATTPKVQVQVGPAKDVTTRMGPKVHNLTLEAGPGSMVRQSSITKFHGIKIQI